MALAIKISNDSGNGTTEYALNAKSINITHQMSPISAPIPGEDPLLIDLGTWKSTIVVSGIVKFAGTDLSDGAVVIADRDNIESIVDPTATNTWYDQNITLTDDTGSNGTTYTVKITGLKLDHTESTDFYEFTLSMVGHL